MFEWFNILNLIEYVDTIRQCIPDFKNQFAEILMYSFPNAAWVLFGTSLLIVIWGEKKFVLFLFPATGILLELFQYQGIVSGCFDYWDMIFILIISIFPIFIFFKFSINFTKI